MTPMIIIRGQYIQNRLINCHSRAIFSRRVAEGGFEPLSLSSYDILFLVILGLDPRIQVNKVVAKATLIFIQFGIC